MNKLFTKIATAFVGIAMAVGVGVAVGSHSDVKRADAASATWNKITTDPVSGTQYLIIDSGGTKLFDASVGTIDSTSNPVSVTVSNNSVTGDYDSKAWTFTKSGNNWYISRTVSNTTTYIGRSANSNGITTGSSGLNNTISNSSGTFTISGQYKQLSYNSQSGRFRYFGSGTVQLFQKSSSGTKLSTPTNLSVNGTTMSWTNVSNNSGYAYSIDTSPASSETTGNLNANVTSFDASTLSLSAGNYTFKIKAKGNGTTYTDSDYTSTVNFSISGGGSSDSLIITPDYLGLNTTGITSETTLTATDSIKYVAAPSTSSFTVKKTAGIGDKAYDTNSKAIQIGKQGAYLYNNDAFDNPISTFKVYSNSGASTNVSVAVEFSTSKMTSAISSNTTHKQTLSTANTADYDFTYADMSANYTFFRLQIMNAYNAQIQIEITFEEESSDVAASVVGNNSVEVGTQWSGSVTEDVSGDAVPGVTYSFVASGGAAISASSASNGTFTASSAGTVTVSATKTGYSIASKAVTVTVPAVAYITPSKASTSGYTGGNETLSFTYGNLTGSLGVVSSNTSVVTVDTPSASAGSGTVQINFVAAGSTTVKFNDGSTEMASVSVSVADPSVTITGLAATGNVYVGKTLNLGSTITVTATGSLTSDVTWESEDDSIAEVSAAGVVTGVAEGTVDITVTSDDYPSATMTCAVTVSTQPLQYVMNFGSIKNTNPTEIKTDESYKSTWSGNEIDDVTVGDFQKIYGVSSSQLKAGSGSATASISFTIPSDSYITSVVVVVETAGGTSMNVVSGAASAQTENQTIAAGTLTFDDYLASEKSNYVLITSTASGAFYLSSITINYANFAAELTASPSSFDVSVNTPQNVTLTPSHFTPTSYSAVVKSGSSLTASAVAFSSNTATITAGSLTGVTVFTITGTGGGKNASVDVTVNVTQVRNLTDLTITTASDKTTFKVGETFDVGTLVITATFDAEPTTVVYSKANGNIGALTAAPEIGYEFQESDIGTVTSAIFELEVGTGDEMVEYGLTIIDKTYAAKVTNVQDLWDGQQIYFGDQEGTRVNIAHAGGNQLGSQTAVVHSTKGLSVDELAHDGAYTVHREKIDSIIYYSFVKDGYYLEASNLTNNYLTRTDTLSDNCRFTISISEGVVSMTNKGNSDRPEFRWNSGSSWFTQYQGSSEMPKAVIYAIKSYSEQAVADDFAALYLHMDESTSGQCNTYYPLLKPVWAAMGDLEKAALSGAPYQRLQAWAAAHGEHLDGDMNIVSNSKLVPLVAISKVTNTTIIVVVTVGIAAMAFGGYFLLRKKKED